MSLAKALAKAGFESAENSAPKLFLSTGNPVLDHRISGLYHNGGFPLGRIAEVFGPPSAGKTAIATRTMISAQQAGGFAIFMDHERSFDIRLAKKLGLDDDPEKWIFLKPDTFEESMDAVVEIGEVIRSGESSVPKDAPICVVFDSLASMVPKSKWDKSAADYNMNDTTALSRATSSALPAFSQRVEKWNMCALFLNQARTKPGVMFGDPTTTPGGQSMEFYSSVRLKLGGSKMKDDVGKHIGCQTVKNKIYRPFLKTTWDFVFQEDGSGKLDVTTAVVDELVAIDVLEKDGSKILFDGKKYWAKEIAKKVDNEGRQAELIAMLP